HPHRRRHSAIPRSRHHAALAPPSRCVNSRPWIRPRARKPWRRGRSWMREPNSWSLPRRTLPNTEEEASSGAAAALAPIPTKSANAHLTCAQQHSTWTPSPGTQENLPVGCVTWYEAYAFCIWDGGFLPSGAEWEYAAAGVSQQREYPWGSTAPGTGNQYAIYNSQYGGNPTDIA